MTITRTISLFVIFITGGMGSAFSLETDQFMVWGVELEDSSGALNDHFNSELEAFLEERNSKSRGDCQCHELMPGFYKRIFRGLLASRDIYQWILHSSDIDLYPPLDESTKQYRTKSIYRERTFPFILPLSRTIRVGDVYLGLDKLGHMFGFGRRYYKVFRHNVGSGVDEREATEKAIMYGVRMEWTLVGYGTDSVFSHGDLEANYQGFRLIYDSCSGDTPYFVKEKGKWRLDRPVDLRDYVTPDFDESYNVSHYRGLRKKLVLSILSDEYNERRSQPEVEARFARYREIDPSFSKLFLDAYFEERKSDPRKLQFEEAFSVQSSD